MCSGVVEIRAEDPTVLVVESPVAAEKAVEGGTVGQEQGGVEEEREERRKKRKIAAVATERTSAGTEITTPFGGVDDKAM